jgi:hypothetical protein
MSKLQVEELESRQLMNGTGILSQPPPFQLPAASTHALMTTERTSFIHYDGRISAFGWGWSSGNMPDISLLGSNSVRHTSC